MNEWLIRAEHPGTFGSTLGPGGYSSQAQGSIELAICWPHYRGPASSATAAFAVRPAPTIVAEATPLQSP